MATKIAKDLMNLCDTKVLLGLDRHVAEQLQGLLGLSDMESNNISGWAGDGAT
jgi:hypothetical protein